MGSRILKRRTEMDLTQEEVARRVGVSRVAVTKWENGQTGNLKLDNLINLCKLLNFSIEYLVFGGVLKTYNQTSSYDDTDSSNNDYKLDTNKMSLERIEAHQAVDDVPEKDLPQVKKIVETYKGKERRSKPRAGQQGISNQ